MRNPEEQKVFFEDIKRVNALVKEQIPFSANRFEEYECPSGNESIGDINIQFYLHNELYLSYMYHQHFCEMLNSLISEYFNQVRNDNKKTIDAYMDFLKIHIDENIPMLVDKIEQTIGQRIRIRATSLVVPKEMIQKIKKVYLNKILEKNKYDSHVEIDEEEIVELYFKDVREKLRAIEIKIRNQVPLSGGQGVEDELSLLSRYRRDDQPYADQVNRFYESLCQFSAFKKTTRALDIEALTLLMSDAEHNIYQCEKKSQLSRSQNTFLARFKQNEQLSNERNVFKREIGINAISSLIKAKGQSIVLQNHQKFTYINQGMYWHNKKIKVGYCDENASLALYLLFQHKIIYLHSDSIELVDITYEEETGEGHCFLVINRDQSSKLNDIKNWGDNAIILDPWHNLVCYADEFITISQRYTSYPVDAQWCSASFNSNVYKLIENIQSPPKEFVVTNNLDPDVLQERVFEEYGLMDFNADNEHIIHQYFQNIVIRYFENEFAQHHVYFKLSILPLDSLIKIIPGIKIHVIAISQDVINLILNKVLCPLDLDYLVIIELLKIKTSNFMLMRLTFSPEALLKIDQEAIAMIDNSNAMIKCLRIQEERASKINNQLRLIDYYENIYKRFDNEYYDSSPLVRIKLNEIAIAKSKKIYSEKVVEFTYEFLRQVEQYKPKTENSYLPLGLEGKSRKEIFSVLLDYLPALKIELLPYAANYRRTPSMRLRQFGLFLYNLNIDLNNPEDGAFSDELMNKAQQLKLTGLEYLYYAIVRNPKTFGKAQYNYCMFNDESSYESQKKKKNTYYLVFSKKSSKWVLWRFTGEKSEVVTDQQINGLNLALSEINSNKKISHYSYIDFLLQKNHLMRPLGFFKDFQVKINAFINAKTFEEALESAKQIKSFMQTYSEHFSDLDLASRGSFIGSDLAREIRWETFPINENQQYTLEDLPWNRFYSWLKMDVSGIISEMLYRFGVVDSQVIVGLDHEMIKSSSSVMRSSDLPSIQFLSYLPGTVVAQSYYYDLYKFYENAVQLKSEMCQLDVSPLFDCSLSFEEAYINFYDKNKPKLNRPDLNSNGYSKAACALVRFFTYIAKTKSADAIELIRGFYYGREDGRDIHAFYKNHRKYLRSIEMNNVYADFLLLNNADNTLKEIFSVKDIFHFLSNDLPKSDRMIHFSPKKKYIQSLESLSFNEYVEIFSINQHEAENALIELMTMCEENSSNLDKLIFEAYIDSLSNIQIFSKQFRVILKFIMKGHSFYPLFKISSRITWPMINDDLLNSWSLDELIFCYKLFDCNARFGSLENELNLKSFIINTISNLEDNDNKIYYYEQWYTYNKFIKFSLNNVGLKNSIIHNLVDCYVKKYGRDEGLTQYADIIFQKMYSISFNCNHQDFELVAILFLNKINSQNKLSIKVDRLFFEEKRHVSLSKINSNNTFLIMTFSKVFSENNDRRQAFLDYFTQQRTFDSDSRFISFIKNNIHSSEFKNLLLNDAFNNKSDSHNDDMARFYLASYHDGFWELNVEYRMAIVESIFINVNDVATGQKKDDAYRWAFDYVSNRLFFNSHENSEDRLALSIFKTYLEQAEDIERTYLLSACLVVIKDASSVTTRMSVGKKFAMLCTMMGPAYIKLAQAIHSHPATSQSLKDELKHLKCNSELPKRWLLWRQIMAIISDEHKYLIESVDDFLGAASFNQAINIRTHDGERLVLLLLKDRAVIDSQKGFKHIGRTVAACDDPQVNFYRAEMVEAVNEARNLSFNELSSSVCKAQAEIAKKIYRNTFNVMVENQSIKIKVDTADVVAFGVGYKFLEAMEGVDFNDLPDGTHEQRIIKMATAKAVIEMELRNILRGQCFDSDRHGNQLKVKIESTSPLVLKLGLFDFGEMSLNLPTVTDLRQLSKLMTRLIIMRDIYHCIHEAISDAKKCGESIGYLMRVHKGFLALQDFMHYLNDKDIRDIFYHTLSTTRDIHPELIWACRCVANALKINNRITHATNVISSVFSTVSNIFVSSSFKSSGDNAVEVKQKGFRG